MLNYTDLPSDVTVLAADADVLMVTDGDLANAIVILGQLDPTEIDLSTGKPRWSDDQRALIIKANDQLAEWKD